MSTNVTSSGSGPVHEEARLMDGTTLVVDAVEDVEVPARYRKRGRVSMWLAIAWLAFIVFSAVFADALPYVKSDTTCPTSSPEARLTCSTYTAGSPAMSERPPVWATWSDPAREFPGVPERAGWMGTDRNGYDIFSRVIYGARTSLIIAGLSITFGLLIGGTLGLISGYHRGRTDRGIDTVMNILLAFPALLLAIFIVGFFTNTDTSSAAQRSIWPVVFALSILSIPPLTRLVRANTIAFSQREFVTAARALGAKSARVLSREILPNVVPAMLSFALTGIAVLIVAEGALAYLGLSVEAPTPTWGKMIFAGKDLLETSWWVSLLPAAVLFLTVLAINVLGDVLAQRLNVREAVA